MKLLLIKVFHASKASLIHYAGFMLGFGWGMATNTVEEQSKITAFCVLYFFLFLIQDDDKKMFERSKLQMIVVVMFCILDGDINLYKLELFVFEQFGLLSLSQKLTTLRTSSKKLANQ